MTTLHLGVYELPYADPEEAPRPVRKARRGRQRPTRAKGGGGAKTTGDVAEILERKYDIMSHFFEEHGDKIGDALVEALAGATETQAMGGPAPVDPLAPAMQQVAEMFGEFIDHEEMAGLEDGVPTAAAIRGVSHRFKHPYAKGHPRRPSFVDTGQYRDSFVAWMTED